MPLIGTPNGGRRPAAPSKVANNENGDKSIERVKQYVLIVARIFRILRDTARARAWIAFTSQLAGWRLTEIVNSLLLRARHRNPPWNIPETVLARQVAV